MGGINVKEVFLCWPVTFCLEKLFVGWREV
jgi:hypothetical protein